MSRRAYAAVAAIAGVIAVALITASLFGAKDTESPDAQRVFGDDTAALLDGIPQSGPVLGRPDAPVTLVEFGDLQCVYCAQWSTQAFGELVHEYVRPGKVRLVFDGLSFLGPDSERALRFAVAAGSQGKLWNVVHLLYANQGAENSGWVSDELLRGIGAAIPGFHTGQALSETSSARVESNIADAKATAERLGVEGTPSFAAGRAGRPVSLVPVRTLDADGLRPVLDQLLAK